MGKILVVLRPPGTDNTSKRIEQPLLVPKHTYTTGGKDFSNWWSQTHSNWELLSLQDKTSNIHPLGIWETTWPCFPQVTGSLCLCGNLHMTTGAKISAHCYPVSHNWAMCLYTKPVFQAHSNTCIQTSMQRTKAELATLCTDGPPAG